MLDQLKEHYFRLKDIIVPHNDFMFSLEEISITTILLGFVYLAIKELPSLRRYIAFLYHMIRK